MHKKGLQEPFVCERIILLRGNNQVVQELDIQKRVCTFNFLSEFFIYPGRLYVARGMIVADNKCTGIGFKSGYKDDLRIGHRAAYTTRRNIDQAQHLVAPVELVP